MKWYSGTVMRTDPIVDWARMTDEQPHVLTAGTDFSRPWRNVRKAAGMWAHRNGYSCRTEYDADGETLTVMFLPREAGWV